MTNCILPATRLTADQIQALMTEKIFFGHQSVGDDIVLGIRDIIASDPRLDLHLVTSANPETVLAPAFVEARIGNNTAPASKNQALLSVLDRGFSGIALFKYCYVDIGGATDVYRMFREYRSTVERVRREHPQVRLVHCTVPLTTVGPVPRAFLKSLLGGNTTQDDNIKRRRFNDALTQTYSGEPIFDIARIESTHPDGSRSYFTAGGEVFYTLAPEYSDDGGHLNALGRRLAATHLLDVLAGLAEPTARREVAELHRLFQGALIS